jgi:2-phospho-L-lactate guanylyltransferase
MSTTCALLVPVKAWDRAKTRLVSDGTLPAVLARDLALAFAADAVAAAVRSPLVARVYVVTDQPELALPDVTVLPDEGAGDLNAALRAAAVRIGAHHPDLGVAAMCADLPCLRTEDLTTALGSPDDGWGDRWFVADVAGTGTTLLGAAPGHELAPAFGAGSAARHRDSGARPLDAPLTSLRLDVDTADDLGRAVALGTGPRTAAVLAAHAVSC